MKKIIKILPVLSLMVLINAVGFGKTRVTAEQSGLQTVKLAMQLFMNEHHGNVPTNWSQIAKYIDLDNLNQQRLLKSPSYPLQEHYVFITEKIPVPGYEMGDVVLIGSNPALRDKTSEVEGRYIISRHEGTLKFDWLPEEKVQAMLTKAGVKLPEPERLVSSTNQTNDTAPLTNFPKTELPSPSQANIKQYHSPDAPNPVEPSVTPQVAAETTQSVSPSTNWLPVVAVLILGSVLVFVLLRRKKE